MGIGDKIRGWSAGAKNTLLAIGGIGSGSSAFAGQTDVNAAADAAFANADQAAVVQTYQAPEKDLSNTVAFESLSVAQSDTTKPKEKPVTKTSKEMEAELKEQEKIRKLQLKAMEAEKKFKLDSIKTAKEYQAEVEKLKEKDAQKAGEKQQKGGIKQSRQNIENRIEGNTSRNGLGEVVAGQVLGQVGSEVSDGSVTLPGVGKIDVGPGAGRVLGSVLGKVGEVIGNRGAQKEQQRAQQSQGELNRIENEKNASSQITINEQFDDYQIRREIKFNDASYNMTTLNERRMQIPDAIAKYKNAGSNTPEIEAHSDFYADLLLQDKASTGAAHHVSYDDYLTLSGANATSFPYKLFVRTQELGATKFRDIEVARAEEKSNNKVNSKQNSTPVTATGKDASKVEASGASIDGMDEKKVGTWAKFLEAEMRNQKKLAGKNTVETQLKAMAVIYMDVYEQTGEKPTPKQLRAFYRQATGDTEFNIIPRETSLTQQCIEFIQAEKDKRVQEATKDIEKGKKEGSKVKELNGKERLQQLGDLKISANLDLKSLGVEGMETLRMARLETHKNAQDMSTQALSFANNLNGRGGMGGRGA